MKPRIVCSALVLSLLLAGGTFGQCVSDSECKGSRICVDGRCVNPSETTGDRQPPPESPEPKCGPDQVYRDGVCVDATPTAVASTEASVRSPKVSLGINPRLGLALSFLSGKGVRDYGDLVSDQGNDFEKHARAGFVFGTGFEVQPVSIFSAELGFAFAFKRFRLNIDGSGPYAFEAQAAYSLAYLEFPLLAKVHIPGVAPFHLCGYAGSVLGFALSAGVDAEMDGDEQSFDLTDGDDTDFEINRAEFGLVFGAEVGYAIGPGVVFVDVRYVPGLTSLGTKDTDSSGYDDDDPGSPLEDSSIGSFQFQACYSFRFPVGGK